MTSAPAGQVLEVRFQRLGEPGQHQNRRIATAALDAGEVGLMHGGAMGQLLLREATRPPKRLHVEADSHPRIHGRMAQAPLTSAHRL